MFVPLFSQAGGVRNPSQLLITSEEGVGLFVHAKIQDKNNNLCDVFSKCLY